MSGFTNGLLVGLGVSLLFAPRKGQEMRSLLAERFRYVRGIPPENEELKQQVQHMGQRVQEVQQQANRAAEMGNSVQSDLKNVAQQAGTDVPSKGSAAAPKQSNQPNQPNQPNRPNRPRP